jgi:CRP-like cAMP-binding protein
MSIRQRVQAVVQDLAPVPDHEYDRVWADCRTRTLARGEHLIALDQRVDHTWFIDEGMLRIYYLRDGREINRSFVEPGRFYTNSLSFRTGEPSRYAAAALMTTRILAIPRSAVRAMLERHDAWVEFDRRATEVALALRERREQRFRSLSPEEHYRWLIENRRDLVARIPLYHIASYLGISPETLSRIRSRMWETT